jgi:membrane-bound metal-dependent hydrolase YbcI (DUF457 family)
MGAAVAMPAAAALPVAGAIGCVWFGLSGGAMPDYLDFKSDARHALRHRGISHSLLALAVLGGFVWFVLDALARSEVDLLTLPARYVGPWTASFALGMLSHLAGDACTRGGIQPLLPLLRTRVWLLPRFLRVRSDGRVNFVAKLVSLVVIGVSVAGFVAVRFAER